MLNSEFEKIIRKKIKRSMMFVSLILIPIFFIIGWWTRTLTQNDKEQTARINACDAIKLNAYDEIRNRFINNIIRDQLQDEDKLKFKRRNKRLKNEPY
jgi:hypothetical protein